MIQAAMWIASVLFFVWLAWLTWLGLRAMGPMMRRSWIKLRRSMITDDYYMLWGIIAVVSFVTLIY